MIYDQVIEHARRAPERTCVLEGRRAYTFAQLLDQVEAGRRDLARAGIGPGDLVAVACAQRGPAIAGMLSAWAVGAAYLPLASGMPKARIETIMDIARPAALLTDPGGNGDCVTDAGFHLLDDPAQLDPATAYVIFTSGSTGTPKGVMVGHAGLGPLTEWYREITTLTPGDMAGQIAQLSFDASVLEIWGALANGASLAVPTLDDLLDPGDYQDFLLRNQIRAAFVPTGLVASVLDLEWPADFPTRMVFTGGDRLTRWPEPRHPFLMYNIYGPAECTVAASAQHLRPRIGPSGPPPIGRPLPYVKTRVAVNGELWLGGLALSLGYLGAANDAFVQYEGERWYRTGDVVTQDDDGVLHFVSRIDDQLQIGGRRTEPAEIVHAILKVPEVNEAVVFTRETPTGETRLAAAVTPASAAKKAIHRHLQQTLPPYMIPSEILPMDTLPLTGHGKFDVAALRSGRFG